MSIALSANMNPTSALIAENSASLLLSGATATANSRESKSAGTRFTLRARGESLRVPARTALRVAGWA